MPSILKQIHGRDFGLGPENELIVNQSGLGGTTTGEAFVEYVSDVTIPSYDPVADNGVVFLYAKGWTLVSAPGANRVIIPTRMLIHKPASTYAYSMASAEDLAVRWGYSSGTVMGTNGPSSNIVIETNYNPAVQFLTSAATQSRYVQFQNGYSSGYCWMITGMANQPLVMGMSSGEIGPATGSDPENDCAPLYVRTWYTIVPETLG